MRTSTIWRISLIPSVYSIVVWTVLLLALISQIITVNVSISAYAIYSYTLLCFILSAFINHKFTTGIIIKKTSESIQYNATDKGILIIFILVGSYGIYKYISDFSKLLGGENFFFVFFINPLKIRELAAEETSIGFQLSYFTWPIIPYLILSLRNPSHTKAKRAILITGIIFCFFANTLFIDRTRPVLLLITGVLTFLIIFNEKIKNPLRILSVTLAGPIVIFFGQALFTSKYDANEGLIQNFLVYLLGGFGYFSEALDDPVQGYSLANTLMPAYKALASIGLTAPPPPQILDFKNVPFPTNVGTFLQPLIADGGWLLVLLLLPFLVCFLDFIALRAFKSNTLFGIFLWANLVAASLLSFFVPKFNSTYLYLFFVLYAAIITLKILQKYKRLFRTRPNVTYTSARE